MREEARRLWARARQCRDEAETTDDEAARKRLIELANDLAAKAAKIEAQTPEPS
jgi:hypothetical protein